MKPGSHCFTASDLAYVLYVFLRGLRPIGGTVAFEFCMLVSLICQKCLEENGIHSDDSRILV